MKRELDPIVEMKGPLKKTESNILDSVLALKDLPGRCASFGIGVDLFLEKLLENNQFKDCDIVRPADFNDANWEGFRSGFAVVKNCLQNQEAAYVYCPIIPTNLHVQKF